MTDLKARFGWESDFPAFKEADPATIRDRLRTFVQDASPEQVRAWSDSIPPLQREVDEVLSQNALASRYSAILEYELPLESRRPDAILLVGGGLLVIELKGKSYPSQADIDQAAAYARDLMCYHRECDGRPVVPVLVPTRAHGVVGQDGPVRIVGPDALDAVVQEITDLHLPPIDRSDFLDESAYRPLPTLVKAARELLEKGELRRIHRAEASTGPAVEAIREIVHEAARTRTRHLVLVTGVPGAGKTLVGLQAVHAHYLDDLAVDRGDGKPTAPAVFLSGNGPLVEVLQYELREAGGGGRTFVRDVKNYVKTYSGSATRVPPEHVLVYDEAQRAFDAEMVKQKHKGEARPTKSEPELFVQFANRVPEWCVIVGLIGTGQEIHVGEEAGITQWRRAVENNPRFRDWHVHVPPSVLSQFSDSNSVVPVHSVEALSLDVELRQHTVTDLHAYVAGILAAEPAADLRRIAERLEQQGFHLRITRSLDVAKRYLWDRYSDHPDARFGIVASARDKALPRFGVMNDFQSTKRTKFGPWYGEGEDSALSCRHLNECVTEFGAQGLELDAALLAWGTDLRLVQGRWSNADASRYKLQKLVRDPMQLRLNAYRVLLTRARDAVVVFAPPLPDIDETYDYLWQSGFRLLV